MPNSIVSFTLDMNGSVAQKQMKVKVGDSARTIKASVCRDGQPYTIHSGATVTFTATKPDGTQIFNACTYEGNTITYVFTGTETSKLGVVNAEFRIYGVDETVIASPKFQIVVLSSVYDDATTVSTSEYTALSQMVAHGTGVLSQVISYTERAETAKKDSIAYAEGDSERSIIGAKSYMEKASASATSASTSASNASTSEANALTYKKNALEALGGANRARSGAETAQGLAETAQGLAETAQGKAEDAMNSAKEYAGFVDGVNGAKQYYQLAQEYAENSEENATNAGYYASVIESSAQQISDNKDYIEALNGIVENIRECNEEITEVTVEGFTVGTCYSATGYSSSPVYRCYSGFFDNDGGEYNFDATKFKMMFTYWNTKDQTARTNIGAWNTSSPAKIERTDIPYVRIQLEELSKEFVDVTTIKVYETIDNTEVIVKKVLSSETKVESHEEMLDELYDVTISELDIKNEKQGIPSSASKTFINFKNEYTHIAVKVRPYEEVSITANANYPCYFCGLKSYTVPSAENINADYSDCSGWTERKTIAKGESLTIMIAEDVKYIVVASKYQGNDYLPSSFKVYPHKIKWVALGDSITEGYFSPSNDEYSSEDPQHRDSALTYVSWVADIKGFTLDNRGVGGSGWMKRGTRQNPKLNAREQIDAFPDGFFKAYDLCTIMWGINDWKGNMNLGSFSDGTNPTTESVYGNMRYVIEKIYESNPSIKVIVITPLNSSRSNDADNPHSTADNNWALGYTGFKYNLNDLFNAIKQVCEYYQIEMIDETHESCVNRLNIESMMPDEVHPSQPAHRQIGIEIAGKIKYNG